MSTQVHFDTATMLPAASRPTASVADNVDGMMTLAQKERMGFIAESRLKWAVLQKHREPALRHVVLHAGFLQKVLDSIDATTPEDRRGEPMMID